ncbi:MAG: GWxTD domain-containing protein [Calditrichaeota bacterium]|nr:MAG: GWxTD domain-containing protein [Calditrichota bacterium]
MGWSGGPQIFSIKLIVLALSLYIVSGQAAEKRNLPQKISTNNYSTITDEATYFHLLKEADSLTFKNEFEAEILLLLDDDLKERYLNLPTLQDKKEFIIFFWKVQNPNPLLEQNDRLLDHLQRRLYARKNFPADTPPYYDDRGKYYVKYGKPFFRYRDRGGLRKINSLVTPTFSHYSVLPNETWSYVNVRPNFVVNFAQKGSVYKEIKSLKDIIVGNRRRGRLIWYWSDLMKNRFWMSPLYNDAVTTIIDVENTILSTIARSPLLSSRNFIIRDNDIRFNTRRLEDELYSSLSFTDSETRRASTDIPVAVYTPVRAKSKLPIKENIAQFKNPDGLTRLEITLYSPMKKFLNRAVSIHQDSIFVEFSSLLRNKMYSTVDENRLKKKYAARDAIDWHLPETVGYLTLKAPPDSLDFFAQVKNERNGKVGFLQKSLKVKDFSGKNLMVSDLQFYTTIEEEQQKAILPWLEINGLTLAPYPFKKIHKSTPFYCYFEVYNLKSGGVTDEYEITYKVYNDKSSTSLFKKLTKWIGGEKERSISITQTQPVLEDMSQELIALDLSNLPNGHYRLEVIVADTKNPSIQASVWREFRLEN